jgi:hypothetical protein
MLIHACDPRLEYLKFMASLSYIQQVQSQSGFLVRPCLKQKTKEVINFKRMNKLIILLQEESSSGAPSSQRDT